MEPNVRIRPCYDENHLWHDRSGFAYRSTRGDPRPLRFAADCNATSVPDI